jgi:hypothetical protein
MRRSFQFHRRGIIASAACCFFVIIAAFFFQGCENGNGVGPNTQQKDSAVELASENMPGSMDAMPAPECSADHTANLTFVNDSYHTIYRVLLDEQYIGLVKPGGTLLRTVSASIHSVQFLYATGNVALLQSVEPGICENATIRCTYEEPPIQVTKESQIKN